ncbi:MAG: ABC-three component system protein [Sedimentisphaerales bacterium]
MDAAEASLITQLTNELGDNADIISFNEIEGMLYYLTGKCHIKWHKE